MPTPAAVATLREAARAAAIAAHSAAGLCIAARAQHPARLLRISEAMARAAVAALASPPVVQCEGVGKGMGVSRSAKRRRRRAAKRTDAAQAGHTDGVDGGPATMELDVGGVVVGDLTEFGMGGDMAVGRAAGILPAAAGDPSGPLGGGSGGAAAAGSSRTAVSAEQRAQATQFLAAAGEPARQLLARSLGLGEGLSHDELVWQVEQLSTKSNGEGGQYPQLNNRGQGKKKGKGKDSQLQKK